MSTASVHPHACGDNQILPGKLRVSNGSPPRVWGQRPVIQVSGGAPRFTPTRVGTTVGVADRVRLLAVHPHACGDNARKGSKREAKDGSPPRVWGQPPPAALGSACLRFTPTRVGTTPPRWRPGGRRAVHPHACGDNFDHSSANRCTDGSPPRVWGQPTSSTRFPWRRGSPPRVWGQQFLGHAAARGDRFTPTRVGTTPANLPPGGLALVHPHACGDNARPTRQDLPRDGSPPRVWGQPQRRNVRHHHLRFTPTRVGTTTYHAPGHDAPAVHPHACGDNGHREELAPWLDGSPPRVWGQPLNLAPHIGRDRFTPTRVGTTDAFVGIPPRAAVHPHACGDNSVVPQPMQASYGSPPRVWGQRPATPCRSPPRRFTPTRVGTTPSGGLGTGHRAVHPHACGDNPACLHFGVTMGGSPPRVWGQLQDVPLEGALRRFTPTRVGTTSMVVRSLMPPPVHPHACGDNHRSSSCYHPSSGSPPRVWGQLRFVRPGAGEDRFTPTRVGTTGRDGLHSRARAVHPHACGDNLRRASSAARSRGSPPRVWGQPPLAPPGSSPVRFTPTRVGTTARRPRSGAAVAVHPHACGDNDIAERVWPMVVGSPPRVWGQPTGRAAPCAAQWFTPTRVGTTRHRACEARPHAVHPHACGDN